MSGVSAVLRTRRPSAILTTSSVAGNIAEHLKSKPGESAPSVIEVDLLDLDSESGSAAEADSPPNIAHLQYTSGSTRTPAGVMISHKNIQANFEQIKADFFMEHGGAAPPDTTMVSWLPFFHDMGLVSGNHLAGSAGKSLPCSRARRRSCSDRPDGCNRWQATVTHSRRRRTSLSNWRHEKHQMTTWPGLTSGTCTASSTAANAYNPRRCSASPSGSPASTLRTQGVAALIWARGSHVVHRRPAKRVSHRKPFISNPRS